MLTIIIIVFRNHNTHDLHIHTHAFIYTYTLLICYTLPKIVDNKEKENTNGAKKVKLINNCQSEHTFQFILENIKRHITVNSI